MPPACRVWCGVHDGRNNESSSGQDKLIAYNAEDCAALKKVAEFVQAIGDAARRRGEGLTDVPLGIAIAWRMRLPSARTVGMSQVCIWAAWRTADRVTNWTLGRASGSMRSRQPLVCIRPAIPVHYAGTLLSVLPRSRETHKSDGRTGHPSRLRLQGCERQGSRLPGARRSGFEQGSMSPSVASVQPSWQGGRVESPPRVAAWRPKSRGTSSTPT